MTVPAQPIASVEGLLITEANQAFDLLLRGQFEQAIELLQTRPYSPWHMLALSMIDLLKAAIGSETVDVEGARAAAYRAHELSTNNLATGEMGRNGWWAGCIESKIIQCDALALQAMSFMIEESRFGAIQCAYKLNSSYRLCCAVFKEVMPNIENGQSVIQIASWIDTLFKADSARRADSHRACAKQTACWTDDVVVAYVVTACCYQKDILFSLLPVHARTVVDLVYRPSDRQTALNLLKVAALYGSGVHSTFAALALLTFDTLTLQASLWVYNRPQRIHDASHIVEVCARKGPRSVLWACNDAKLARAGGDLDQAREILVDAIADRKSHFPSAEIILIWELLWTEFARGEWFDMLKCAMTLVQLNSKFLITYLNLAFGALKLISNSRLDSDHANLMHELVETRLPAAIGSLRAAGQLYPGAKFFSDRLEYWKARQSRSAPCTRLADTVSVSPALEHALLFGNLQECSPQTLTELFRGLVVGHECGDSSELPLRNLLKGVMLSAEGRYLQARPFLEMATVNFGERKSGAFIKPLAYFELAGLTLKTADSVLANNDVRGWTTALEEATDFLDRATVSKHFHLASRFGVRVQACRIEIAAKRNALAH